MEKHIDRLRTGRSFNSPQALSSKHLEDADREKEEGHQTQPYRSSPVKHAHGGICIPKGE